MKPGVRVFVLLVFLAMGLSFIATTSILAKEFWADDVWLDFLTVDSHLFLFFPIGGIIALAAFYLPSCAIVDLYWNHLTLGRLRFLLGMIVIVAASWGVATMILSSKNKTMWSIAPQTLLSDKGQPENCLAKDGDCNRVPLITAVKNLREVSKSRQSLGPLVRTCKFDPLIERTSQEGPKRYCIVTTPYSPRPVLKTDDECCSAQKLFLKKVADLQSPEGLGAGAGFVQKVLLPAKIFETRAASSNLSLTGLVHGLFLPLKVFFLLVLVAMSVLMTVHFRKIAEIYKPYLLRIETGLLIGTFAVLFFPLMSQAFLQSVDAMVGDLGRGNFSNIVPVMSFLFGVWTLLILLYFYRRGDREAEILAKVGGAAGGIVALLQYQSIVDFLVSTVGSGAEWYIIVATALLAPILVFVILSFLVSPKEESQTNENQS